MREVQKCVLEKGITIAKRNFLSFVVSYPQAGPVDIAVASNFVTCPWAAQSLPRGRVSRSHPGECASVTPSLGLGEHCNGAEICPPFFFIFLSCLFLFFFLHWFGFGITLLIIIFTIENKINILFSAHRIANQCVSKDVQQFICL